MTWTQLFPPLVLLTTPKPVLSPAYIVEGFVGSMASAWSGIPASPKNTQSSPESVLCRSPCVLAAQTLAELDGSNATESTSSAMLKPPSVLGDQLAPHSVDLKISLKRVPATRFWELCGSIASAATSTGADRLIGSTSPALAVAHVAPPSVDLKIPRLGTPLGVTVPA